MESRLPLAHIHSNNTNCMKACKPTPRDSLVEAVENRAYSRSILSPGGAGGLRQPFMFPLPSSPDSMTLSLASCSPMEISAMSPASATSLKTKEMPTGTEKEQHLDLLGEIIHAEAYEEEIAEVEKKVEAPTNLNLQQEEDETDEDRELDMDELANSDAAEDQVSTSSASTTPSRKGLPHRACRAADEIPGVVFKFHLCDLDLLSPNGTLCAAPLRPFHDHEQPPLQSSIQILRHPKDFANYKSPAERAQEAAKYLPLRRHRVLRRQLADRSYYTPITGPNALARRAAYQRGGSMSFHGYDGCAPFPASLLGDEAAAQWFSSLASRPAAGDDEEEEASPVEDEEPAAKMKKRRVTHHKKSKSKARGQGEKVCCSCGSTQTPIWREVKEAWGDGWEDVLLCNACGLQWRMSSLRCSDCCYVPRASEKRSKQCPRCEDGKFYRRG